MRQMAALAPDAGTALSAASGTLAAVGDAPVALALALSVSVSICATRCRADGSSGVDLRKVALDAAAWFAAYCVTRRMRRRTRTRRRLA